MDASPDTIGHLLLKWPVALVPGGVLDKPRPRGFLRRSYETWQRPVVPVWSAGETDLVWQWWPATLVPIVAWGMWALRYPVGAPYCLKPWWMVKDPLEVRVGKPVHPRDYDTLESFEEAYWAALDSLRKK